MTQYKFAVALAVLLQAMEVSAKGGGSKGSKGSKGSTSSKIKSAKGIGKFFKSRWGRRVIIIIINSPSYLPVFTVVGAFAILAVAAFFLFTLLRKRRAKKRDLESEIENTHYAFQPVAAQNYPPSATNTYATTNPSTPAPYKEKPGFEYTPYPAAPKADEMGHMNNQAQNYNQGEFNPYATVANTNTNAYDPNRMGQNASYHTTPYDAPMGLPPQSHYQPYSQSQTNVAYQQHARPPSQRGSMYGSPAPTY